MIQNLKVDVVWIGFGGEAFELVIFDLISLSICQPDSVAIRVPRISFSFMHCIYNCGSINSCIYFYLAKKLSCHFVQFVKLNRSLSCLNIRSSQSFLFDVLDCSIVVVETFWQSSSHSCYIFEALELPVRPSNQFSFADVSDLVERCTTALCVQAGTKLTQEQRES